MKISRIRSQILVMPQQDPLANTPEDPTAARPIVIVKLDTDDGIEGIGVTLYGGAISASLKRAVDDLGALTIGEDPLRVEAIVNKLRAAAGGSGPAEMFTCTDLCERRSAAQPVTRRGRRGGWSPQGLRLSRDEDAARPARRHVARQGGGAHAAGARGDRARNQADVRHQPALAGRASDRHRQARRRRRAWVVLARRCDDGG